jgi:hypothetical protein
LFPSASHEKIFELLLGAGALLPFYAEEIGVCFVAGKGDTIVRAYELDFLRDLTPISAEGMKEYA